MGMYANIIFILFLYYIILYKYNIFNKSVLLVLNFIAILVKKHRNVFVKHPIVVVGLVKRLRKKKKKLKRKKNAKKI